MKRRFIDACVYVEALESPQAALDTLSHFGYNAVALSTSRASEYEGLLEVVSKLRELYAGKLDIVSRVDIVERSPPKVKKLLSKYRRKVELVAVHCVNVGVARLAARDGRVDLLLFKPSFQFKFDRSEAKMLVENDKLLELQLSVLLNAPGDAEMSAALNYYRNILATHQKLRSRVVISSGAIREDMLRAPKDMASLAFILGLSEEEALDAVSKNANKRVEVNRFKMKKSFIMPGVWVEEHGEES